MKIEYWCNHTCAFEIIYYTANFINWIFGPTFGILKTLLYPCTRAAPLKKTMYSGLILLIKNNSVQRQIPSKFKFCQFCSINSSNIPDCICVSIILIIVVNHLMGPGTRAMEKLFYKMAKLVFRMIMVASNLNIH